MAAPPSLAGAFQTRLIVAVPLAVAVRPVGAPGTVGVTVASVVASSTLEAVPAPTELMAETR